MQLGCWCVPVITATQVEAGGLQVRGQPELHRKIVSQELKTKQKTYAAS
jgi:hypothetical protein